MKPIDLPYEVINGRVMLDRDKLCEWLFDAADETKNYGIHPDGDFCVRSIAEILISFPMHNVMP